MNSSVSTSISRVTPRVASPTRVTARKPWGGYDEFTLNETSSVKILTVLPHEEISLQSHEKRSEWWVILDEKMDVIVDNKQFTAFRGQDVFIPQGSKHRAIGLDKPCRWLEISFGTFDENDIRRYADKYGRSDVSPR